MKNFWCEVYLDKIEHNLNLIKNSAKGKKIIAVVKGNAYGLGIEKISNILNDKVDMFAVTNIDEAKKIHGNKPILLLPPLVSYKELNCTLPNVIYTLCNEATLDKISKEKKLTVHIYVDTGMNRMGIKPNRLDVFIEKIEKNFPNITVDGIYTHLHNTGNKKYTLNQLALFKTTVEKYKNKVSYIHCLNSGGILNSEYINFAEFSNTVRLGNVIYGYTGFSKGFKKTYAFFAKPVNKHFVKKGDCVGYGCKYKAKKDMYIGILGFGAIDHFGFYRNIKNSLIYDILKTVYNHFRARPMIFNEDKSVRLLGRSDMNSTLIDLTDCSLDSLLRVELSPILADSSIDKIYILSSSKTKY